MGWSFRMALTSTIKVWSSISVIDALPSAFLIALSVNPMSRSQKPPYQGARLGMDFHSTPWRPNSSFSEFFECFRSSEVGRSIIRFHVKWQRSAAWETAEGLKEGFLGQVAYEFKMYCPGYSTDEETNVALGITTFWTHIKGSREIHSSNCKGCCFLDSILGQGCRNWSYEGCSFQFSTSHTAAKTLPYILAYWRYPEVLRQCGHCCIETRVELFSVGFVNR